MALIFHFKCTLKCHMQFVSIWTSLKFCHLVMGLYYLDTFFKSSQAKNTVKNTVENKWTLIFSF